MKKWGEKLGNLFNLNEQYEKRGKALTVLHTDIYIYIYIYIYIL